MLDLSGSNDFIIDNISEIENKIENLCLVNTKIQNLEIVSLIKDIVPEYVSNNSTYEVLDVNQSK